MDPTLSGSWLTSVADVQILNYRAPVTLEEHQLWVLKGGWVACFGLAGSVVAQALLNTDFKGAPFLAFGLIVGTLGASLLVRSIWERFADNRD